MSEELTEPQKEINELVAKAQKALEEYASYDQEKIDYIVAKASVAALDHHGSLAKLAVEETKRGVLEDKATKNLFACEYVVNHMRHLKTVGVIEDDDVTGIVKIAEPVGVVAGLTPVTNPTSTAIFKSLICLKTRNPIIFSFHPSAIQCSIAAAKIVYDAAVAAGAPKDCIQWIVEPSLEKTNLLIGHPGVATILATGGNAMVRAAYSQGKPALGVPLGRDGYVVRPFEEPGPAVFRARDLAARHRVGGDILDPLGGQGLRLPDVFGLHPDRVGDHRAGAEERRVAAQPRQRVARPHADYAYVGPPDDILRLRGPVDGGPGDHFFAQGVFGGLCPPHDRGDVFESPGGKRPCIAAAYQAEPGDNYVRFGGNDLFAAVHRFGFR